MENFPLLMSRQKARKTFSGEEFRNFGSELASFIMVADGKEIEKGEIKKLLLFSRFQFLEGLLRRAFVSLEMGLHNNAIPKWPRFSPLCI